MDHPLSVKRLAAFLVLLNALIMAAVYLNYKYAGVAFACLLLSGYFVRKPEVLLALVLNGYFLLNIVGEPLDKVNELTLATKVLCMCGLAVLWWTYEKGPSFLGTPVFVYSLILGILVLVGVRYSRAPNYGFHKSVNFFLNNIFILFGAAFIASRLERLKNLYLLLIIFGLILGVSGILKLMLGLEEGDRLTIFDINTIWVARSLGLSLLLSFFFYKMGDSRQRMLITLAGIVMVGAMLFTLSRGPIIGLLLVAATHFMIYSKKRTIMKFGYASIAIFGLLAMLALLPESLTGRFFEFGGRKDVSGLMRVVWLTKLLPAISQNFMVGIGTGGFSKLITGIDIRTYPHNIIAEIGLENGLVGLLVFALFIRYTIKYAFELTKSRDVGEDIANLAICAFLVLTFASFNAMFSGDLPANEQIWFASGVILGLHSYHRSTRQIGNHLSD